MTDFKTVRGFEDVWRPTARTRFNLTPASLGSRASGAGEVRARLERIAGGAPQVVVSLTGRRRNHGQLLAHLNYISRNGRLELEDRDGNALVGRQAMRELADDWTLAAASNPRRRIDTSVGLSLVLSMPAGTNPDAVRDAGRAFGRTVFGDRFDYAFVLHTDVDHPHVHMTVQTSDERGRFLKPWKTDLELWRQVFAEALRERGVEAEATPRAARGITRKTEHPLMRRVRERHEHGHGEPARHVRDAYLEAARAAFQGETALTAIETRLLERQTQIRALYLAQAKLLREAKDPQDQKLGLAVEDFVRSMPEPDSQRLAFARELRAANERVHARDRQRQGPEVSQGKDRDR